METEILLLGTLISLSLPFLGYNIKLLIIALLVFFLCFPEEREKIWNSPLIKDTYHKIKDAKNGVSSKPEVVLIKEGNQVIEELFQLKLNKRLKGQLVSIQILWKNFAKLSQKILDQSQTIPYPHHHYETMKDLRQKLLNQISGLITGSSPDSIRERTLLKDRNLPRDEKIREFLRKMEYILDKMMLELEKQINLEWSEYPYSEINPVQWTGPQPYDPENLETIL